ncbi:hypothetical protein JCM10908_006983 [Rhodotorula pacifica]|uniref:uncharacterized protein n=1 Tax=Rhodotorula pacifica TaxID=1495444 RepID=UPI0031711219
MANGLGNSFPATSQGLPQPWSAAASHQHQSHEHGHPVPGEEYAHPTGPDAPHDSSGRTARHGNDSVQVDWDQLASSSKAAAPRTFGHAWAGSTAFTFERTVPAPPGMNGTEFPRHLSTAEALRGYSSRDDSRRKFAKLSPTVSSDSYSALHPLSGGSGPRLSWDVRDVRQFAHRYPLESSTPVQHASDPAAASWIARPAFTSAPDIAQNASLFAFGSAASHAQMREPVAMGMTSALSHPTTFSFPNPASSYHDYLYPYPSGPANGAHQEQAFSPRVTASPSSHKLFGGTSAPYSLPVSAAYPPHPLQHAYLAVPLPLGVPPPAAFSGRASDVAEQARFPVDVSTPFIPSSSPIPHPIVIGAAENRRLLGKIDLTGRTREESIPRRPSTSSSLRRVVDLAAECQACRRAIGRLALRGGTVDEQRGDSAATYISAFYCCLCVPVPASSSISAHSGDPVAAAAAVDPYSGECTYLDHLSAAVDRYLGEDPVARETRPPPATPGKARIGFVPLETNAITGKRRRNKVIDDPEGVLVCDVCKRDVGSGVLKLAANGQAAGASVEILCAHCESRYTRCSDCGGGGGTKGVGRWRCKEMFPLGRKTCQLTHGRIATTDKMDYDVWPIDHLQPGERRDVSDMCRDLFYTWVLGTMAVPEMMESVAPLCRSFEEAEKLCVDSWYFFDPYITQVPEPSAKVRRYIAMRWAAPNSRKKRGRKGTQDRSGSHTDEPDSPVTAPNTQLPSPIREGKTLTGFIEAEHDLTSGIVHIITTLPIGAGESYEASTRLLQHLLARVQEDLVTLNAEREGMQLPAYPLLHTAWNLQMTKRDSRIMSRLEARRGFVPLADFLVKYPDVGLEHFPPQCETYLPPEYLRGFTINAKPVRHEDLPPGYRGPAVAAMAAVQNARPPTV